MISPRFLRPHQIAIRDRLGEDDSGKLKEASAIIKYVKVEETYGIKLSKRGITSDDKVLITIDCNDFIADKKLVEKVSNAETEFSIHVDDTIVYNDKEYLITSVSNINPLRDKPEFIEIICQ